MATNKRPRRTSKRATKPVEQPETVVVPETPAPVTVPIEEPVIESIEVTSELVPTRGETPAMEHWDELPFIESAEATSAPADVSEVTVEIEEPVVEAAAVELPPPVEPPPPVETPVIKAPKVKVAPKIDPDVALYDRHIAEYLDSLTVAPDKNASKFVSLVRTAVRNPKPGILDLLMSLFMNRQGVVSQTNFHMNVSKGYSPAAQRQMSYFYTIFETAARCIRSQRKFNLDINACRVAIDSDAVIDYIVRRVSNLG